MVRLTHQALVGGEGSHPALAPPEPGVDHIPVGVDELGPGRAGSVGRRQRPVLAEVLLHGAGSQPASRAISVQPTPA